MTLLDAIIEPQTKEAHFHLDYGTYQPLDKLAKFSYKSSVCKLTKVPCLKRMDKENIWDLQSRRLSQIDYASLWSSQTKITTFFTRGVFEI